LLVDPVTVLAAALVTVFVGDLVTGRIVAASATRTARRS
jgi:hypothetical protein